MIITKIDAARRQLQTAIELWANDGDPVSAHSLAFAAHQIIHDLNRRNGGPNLLLDEPSIRPEKKNEFANLVKRDANFFKHADNRTKGKIKPPMEIDFDVDSNELLISITIVGLQYLGQALTELEIAFYTWYRVNRPDLLTDAGRELFEKSIPAQAAAALRKMPRKEFLKEFIKVHRASSSFVCG